MKLPDKLKQLISQFIVLVLFILAALGFYLAVKVAFFSSFINIMLIFIAIFILIVACGEMDRIHGFGKYSGTTESQSELPPPPQPPHDNNQPHQNSPQHHQHP
jgi:multisubunit Na+/H+ antiporter MnhC subunit